MINAIVKEALLSKKRKLIQRNFSPKLFISDDIHQSFKKDGFVHLKNVLPAEAIKNLTELFEQIRNKQTYEDTDYYFNTISFQDTDLRKTVIEKTLKIIEPSLPEFINMKEAAFPLGGSYCISPPKASRGCGLHQDPSLVDETKSYSMTIWIPLINTTIENGCLHFVPGSHLWGNFYRSMSIRSSFDDYTEMLWNHAIPIPASVCDILCFDTSILHGSTTNTTDNIRLAVNIPVIPKKSQMKNYFPSKKSIFYNKAESYTIDKNYFINESQYERPSSKYKMDDLITLDNFFTLNNVKELLKETSEMANTIQIKE